MDKIIKINNRAVGSLSRSASLSGNVLSENILIPSCPNPTLVFTSPDDVAKYFGYGSDEYFFAQTYFKGWTGSLTKPRRLVFSKWVSNDTAAYMVGDSVLATTVNKVKDLNNPSITVNINDDEFELKFGKEFNEVQCLEDIAEIITASLNDYVEGATVSVIRNDRFVIVSNKKFDVFKTTIDVCSDGELADLLKLTSKYSPIISQGCLGGDANYNLDRIMKYNRNWVALTYASRLSGDTIENGYPVSIDLAKWAATKDSQYICMLWSNDAEDTNPKSNINLSIRLVDAGLGKKNDDGFVIFDVPIALMYGSKKNSSTNNEVGVYCAFYAGMGDSVNYDMRNSKITFAGKRQEGLPVNVNDDKDYETLIKAGYQVYATFTTRADSFSFTENGAVGGQFAWLDNIYDSVWLSDKIQVTLATLIQDTGRLPPNTAGKAMILAVMESIASKGINNGVIESGNEFTENQKIDMTRIVGQDVSSILTSQGYFVYLVDVIDPEQRIGRKDYGIGFLYTNSGAIHGFVVNNTFYK
ncbi:hypothetical protein N894_1253 [Francisella tularensis subsp. novicida PA10-7858]|nr:hypothetical protein N894_1253 [Francisella tularensis subsp. novicida PA10-7858]